ncbi:MAG: hypothetical protein Q4C12_08185 [Clostridia bacterium]|nr:hypothetical protein [Clostridia bacterium]
MAKKIFALILALAMVLGICAISASAAAGDAPHITGNDRKVRIFGKIAEDPVTSTGTYATKYDADATGKVIEYVIYTRNLPSSFYAVGSWSLELSFNTEAVALANVAGTGAAPNDTIARRQFLYNQKVFTKSDGTATAEPGAETFLVGNYCKEAFTVFDSVDRAAGIANLGMYLTPMLQFSATEGGMPMSDADRAYLEFARIRFYVIDGTKPLNIQMANENDFSIAFYTGTGGEWSFDDINYVYTSSGTWDGEFFAIDMQSSMPNYGKFNMRFDLFNPVHLIGYEDETDSAVTNYYAKNSTTNESYFFGYVRDNDETEYGIAATVPGAASAVKAAAAAQTRGGVFIVSAKGLPTGTSVKAYAADGITEHLSEETAVIE